MRDFEQMRFPPFPKYARAELARCWNCEAELGEAVDAGYAPGDGQFYAPCPKCFFRTWFDLESFGHNAQGRPTRNSRGFGRAVTHRTQDESDRKQGVLHEVTASRGVAEQSEPRGE